MALKNWRAIAVNVLKAEVGPTADILVGDTLRDMNILEGEMVASRFLVFLKKIYHLLPDNVDKNALLYKMRNEVLKQYGFNFEK
jgi:hypothetical protein